MAWCHNCCTNISNNLQGYAVIDTLHHFECFRESLKTHLRAAISGPCDSLYSFDGLQILQLFHWDFGHLDSDTKVVRLEHKASKAAAKDMPKIIWVQDDAAIGECLQTSCMIQTSLLRNTATSLSPQTGLPVWFPLKRKKVCAQACARVSVSYGPGISQQQQQRKCEGLV